MANHFDLLIRDALVFDGSGAPPFAADLAIEGDRIALIGDAGAATAATEIVATGLAVAPGFIDVHTHDDFAALSVPDMAFKTRGGVTTCIVGNCGFGAAPFAAAVELVGDLLSITGIEPYQGQAGYADALTRNGLGPNIGMLAGHGTIRLAAVGKSDRAPDDREMKAMKAHLGEALDAGVLGLSSGLIYEPGCYAATDELVELATEMRGTGALYATHMRDESTGLLDSVREAIDIGARAGVPVQISHHKAAGRESWGLVSQSVELIDAALARGESVHADQYPYTAGSTLLRAVLQNGAFAATSSRDAGIAATRPDDVVIASATGHREWEGLSIAQLGTLFDLPAHAAATRVEAEAPGASVILHMMSEDDVQTVLRHPSTMIGSDGIPTLDGKPHPRLFNTFARVLGHYARDLGLLTMQAAVHRMTGLPAEKFGLRDRGEIRAGAYADLVIFDADGVIDKGTYEDPNQYPDGIVHVIINGGHVIRDGSPMQVRPGRVLRRGQVRV